MSEHWLLCDDTLLQHPTCHTHPIAILSARVCLQVMKDLDASSSEVSELESKLSAAQRRVQQQEGEREEAEAARAQQGQQLAALAQDMQALQSALERVKQDKQQVGCLLLCCLTAAAEPFGDS